MIRKLPVNGFDPWVGKIPWRRVWQSTPVSLPREPRRQGNLLVYNPQVCKESDTTEVTQHSARVHLSEGAQEESDSGHCQICCDSFSTLFSGGTVSRKMNIEIETKISMVPMNEIYEHLYSHIYYIVYYHTFVFLSL